MIDYTLPTWVNNIRKNSLSWDDYDAESKNILRDKIKKFNIENPVVSMVIPAWNEEFGILHTLWSLAESDLKYPTELIIIDNNSTDGTNKLLKDIGIKTIIETKQGCGHARTRGLIEAKGEYLLTGDSDTLYPKNWINIMSEALISGKNDQVRCVHSTYSFIPEIQSQRWMYGVYEFLSGIITKRKEKYEPYLNVFGFYMGFDKQKGIELNGYDIEVQRTFRGSAGTLETNATEDGMMALRIMQDGGTIKMIKENEAKVWTSDRRIQMDGGIVKAFMLRIKKYIFRQ